MTQTTTPTIKRTVFIGAYATGNADSSPDYAKLVIDQAFCEHLAHLQALCIENNLSELRQYDSPEWGPEGFEEESRLSCGELVVTGRDFWFTDIPKHADHRIETEIQGIQAILDADLTENTPLFLGCDSELIEKIVG